MKILIVGYSTDIGGAEKRMISFTNHAARQHDVTLVTFKQAEENFFENDKNCLKHIVLDLPISFKSIFLLSKIIRSEQPDRVYGFLGTINVILGFLKPFFKNITFIVRENATYGEYFKEKGLKGGILKTIYKLGLNSVDIIVAQSKHMKKEQIKLFGIDPGKIFVILNPLPEICPSNPDNFLFNQDKIYLLSVGRLEKVKNQIDMIHALNYLDEKYELIFVGEGSFMETLKKEAIKLSLEKRVHFVGHKNNIGYYYKNSSLLLLTSLRETCPNVALESIYFQRFIISYDIPGGVSEIIQDNKNGVITNKNTVQELAKEIRRNTNKTWSAPTINLLKEQDYNKYLLELNTKK